MLATAPPVASPLTPAAFVRECVGRGIVLSVKSAGGEPTITATFAPGVSVPSSFAPYLKQNKAAVLLYLQTGRETIPVPALVKAPAIMPVPEPTRPVQTTKAIPAPDTLPETQGTPPVTEPIADIATRATNCNTPTRAQEEYPEEEYEYRETRRMVGELCVALRKNAIPMPGEGIPALLLGSTHPAVVTDPPRWVRYAIESAIRLKEQLAECDSDLEAAQRAGYSDTKAVRIRERVIEELRQLNADTITAAKWYEDLPTEVVLPLIMASWNGGKGPLPVEERITL